MLFCAAALYALGDEETERKEADMLPSELARHRIEERIREAEAERVARRVRTRTLFEREELLREITRRALAVALALSWVRRP